MGMSDRVVILWLKPGSSLFFFNDTATTEIYTLSLHDALPISNPISIVIRKAMMKIMKPLTKRGKRNKIIIRSEEHTSELQSPDHLVCRLLLEKKKIIDRDKDFTKAATRCAPQPQQL